MGRRPCCEMEAHEKKRPWTAEEDQKLAYFIAKNGFGCWRAVPKPAGLLRCGNSCRLRWNNYLRPDLKRRIFSDAEGIVILNLHATLGNRWSLIAAKLPGRTDNEIKNYWNKTLKKTLINQGLDPATHLPLDSTNHSNDSGGDTETAECFEDTDIVLNDSVATQQCSEFIHLEEPVQVGKDEHSVLVPSSASAVSEPQGERESIDREKSPSTCSNHAFLDRELCRTESPAIVVVEVEAKEGLHFAPSGSSVSDFSANVNHYSPMLLDASNEGSTPFLEEELSWEGLQALVSRTKLTEQSLDLHAQEAGGDYSGVVIPGSSLLHPGISIVWSMDGNIEPILRQLAQIQWPHGWRHFTQQRVKVRLKLAAFGLLLPHGGLKSGDSDLSSERRAPTSSPRGWVFDLGQIVQQQYLTLPNSRGILLGKSNSKLVLSIASFEGCNDFVEQEKSNAFCCSILDGGEQT